MTFPAAFFYVGMTFTVCFFLFLLVVYLKEYAREERIMKQAQIHPPDVLYLVPPAPTKKTKKVVDIDPEPKNDDKKKNLN